MPRVRYQRRVKAGPHVAGIATPVNTVLPVITGNTAGQTSTTSDGTWSNADHFIYQWYLDSVLLSGETASSIDTDADWAGQTLSVVVCGGAGGGYTCVAANGVVLQGSSYTGPLDLVPGAVVAYGVRALSAAWLGQNIFRLRRDSDDAESDFAANAVTGDAPVASIIAWLAGANGYLAKWYDQSANANFASQVIAAVQPAWSDDNGNGKCGFIAATGTNGALDTTASIQLQGAATFFAVAKQNAGGDLIVQRTGSDYLEVFFRINGGNSFVDIFQGSNEGGGLYTSDWDGDIAILEALGSNGNSAMLLNGSSWTQAVNFDDGGALSTFSFPATIGIYGSNPNCSMQEMLLYPSILSSGDRTTLRQNIATYYGITL